MDRDTVDSRGGSFRRIQTVRGLAMSFFQRIFGSLFHNPADDFNVPGAEFEGRPIGAWFLDLSASSAAAREKAEIALAAIGEPALPALATACAQGSPPTRIAAASALGRLGPGALPTLVELMLDDEARVAVPVALVRMGPDCLPALADALAQAEDDDTREALAHTLGTLAQSSHLLGTRMAAKPPPVETHDPLQPKRVERVVEERTKPDTPRTDAMWDFAVFASPLLGLLESATPALRREATRALWRIGARGGRTDPALVAALGDEDFATRLHAAGALAELDAALPEARAVVERSLALEPPEEEPVYDEEGDDAEPPVPPAVQETRLAVAAAMSFHQEAGAALVAPLVDCLTHPDAEVRYRTKVALAGLGAGAVAPLAKAAAETDADVRRRIAAIFGEMRQQYAALHNAETTGETDDDAHEALSEAAKAEVAARAASLRGVLPAIFRALIALADDKRPEVSERAVRSLGFVALERIPDEVLDAYAAALERHDAIAFHDLVAALLRADPARRRERGLPLFRKLDENGRADVLLEILRDAVKTAEFAEEARRILDDMQPDPALLAELAAEITAWVEEKAPEYEKNLEALKRYLG